MIEINLIPDVKQELLKAQRARAIVISAAIFTSIAAVAVVAVLLAYIYGVQLVRGSVLDGQITSKNDELSKVEDLSKILTIQNQLAGISALNDQKVMASRIFDVMSAITPPEIAVSFSRINLSPVSDSSTSETASSVGQIQFEGQADGYDTLELIKKRIENTSFEYTENGEKKLVPLASNITTGDISYGEGADGARVLRFSIQFDYAEELLSSKTADQQLAFKLVVNGNVTDSYLGIPRFSQRAEDEGGK